jgi:hypothetical protein
LYGLETKAAQLADRLGEEYADAANVLRNSRAQPSPVWRLAEALTFLQGRKNTQGNVLELLDSALLTDRPNGLAVRRSVARMTEGTSGRRRRDVRSLVFTDAVLDYLVHVHVLRTGNKEGFRSLSLKGFLEVLRNRYGLYVDEAPPGLPISNELLRLNRLVLERRLRDLGLLLGVNDADAMKRLTPRFRLTEGSCDDLD